MKTSKKSWAAYLYLNLPDELQTTLADFLTNNERKRLLDNKPEQDQAEISKSINQQVVKAARQQKAPHTFARAYGGFHLVLATVAFLSSDAMVAMNYLLYGIAGFFLIRSKRPNYWKYRLLYIPFQWHFLSLSVLSFAAIMPVVGMLSLKIEASKLAPILLYQAVLFGPFFEELLFRDYLFRALQPKNSKIESYVFAIIMSSILFAFIHLNPGDISAFAYEFFVYFYAGLVLALLRWYTKSLLFTFIVHMSVNLFIIRL